MRLSTLAAPKVKLICYGGGIQTKALVAVTVHAGCDASEPYNAIHPSALLSKTLDPSKLIGTLDAETIDSEWTKPPPKKTPELVLNREKPPLETVVNAFDFEEIASRTLTSKTWAFYSSGATDCITRNANHSRFDQIWFRPRVLVNVDKADTSTTILGNPVSMPLFVSPAALARMIHPDGEIGIAKGAATKGIMQAISTNASFSIDEICPASPDTTFFLQLYMARDRAKSSALLMRAKELGMKAVILTVDAPVIGKREADERVKNDQAIQSGISGGKTGNDKKGSGVGRQMGSFIDPRLEWKDLQWLRKETDLPLIVKGIQTAADAQLCMEAGVQGIICSNHGGRELDGAPAAVMVLLELQKVCPEVFDHMEVYVDGGIRRGTDILKCLCLGAKAVGIGRTFLYALNYGPKGVEHLIESKFPTYISTLSLLTHVSSAR